MKIIELLSAELVRKVKEIDPEIITFFEETDFDEGSRAEIESWNADPDACIRQLEQDIAAEREALLKQEAERLNAELAEITFGEFMLSTHLRISRSGDQVLRTCERLMELLTKEGYEPYRYKDTFGKTMLYYVARSGSNDAIQMLLDRGFKVDATTNEGKTPLMKAARRASLSTVTLLLDNGANVNHQDNKGMTALIKATVSGNIEIVNELLNKGASRELIGTHTFLINDESITISGTAADFAHQLLPLYVDARPHEAKEITTRMNACILRLKAAPVSADTRHITKPAITEVKATLFNPETFTVDFGIELVALKTPTDRAAKLG